MVTKPIKSLELHDTMIYFLIFIFFVMEWNAMWCYVMLLKSCNNYGNNYSMSAHWI